MAKASEYICPNCGGGIVFDSASQKMKCPFCDYEYDVETIEKYAEDLKTDGTEDEKWEQASEEFSELSDGSVIAFRCNSCGGEILADTTTSASICPYCDNPVIMLGSLKGQLKPDTVIPFKSDKQKAVEQFRKHLLKKRFLPDAFKQNEHFDEIKGVYVPFWVFDSDIKANIRYKTTKVRTWHSGNYDYTETSYYSVVRGGTMAFDKVAVDGSSKMPNDLMDSIEPFDYSQAVPFNTGYLAGYVADKYDEGENISVKRVNSRIKNSVEKAFEKSVSGYNSVKKEGSNIDYHTAKAIYSLYPVWLLTTHYEDKIYKFAMNGQTEKFVGDLPCDKKKYWRWFISGSLILGTLATTAAMLIQYMKH